MVKLIFNYSFGVFFQIFVINIFSFSSGSVECSNLELSEEIRMFNDMGSENKCYFTTKKTTNWL